jgi:hypothetical protein
MRELTYIRYWDHVLFRNADPSLFNPVMREAIGWIVKNEDEVIVLVFDKSVHELPCEVTTTASGMVILKHDIVEMKQIG